MTTLETSGGGTAKGGGQELREEAEVKRGFLEQARFEPHPPTFLGQLLVNLLSGSARLDLQYLIWTPGGRQVALLGPLCSDGKKAHGALPTITPLSRERRS